MIINQLHFNGRGTRQSLTFNGFGALLLWCVGRATRCARQARYTVHAPDAGAPRLTIQTPYRRPKVRVSQVNLLSPLRQPPIFL